MSVVPSPVRAEPFDSGHDEAVPYVQDRLRAAVPFFLGAGAKSKRALVDEGAGGKGQGGGDRGASHAGSRISRNGLK